MTRGIALPISGQARALTIGAWANGLWASLWIAAMAWSLRTDADPGTRVALAGVLGVLAVLRSGMAILWSWHAVRRGGWLSVPGALLPILALWTAATLL